MPKKSSGFLEHTLPGAATLLEKPWSTTRSPSASAFCSSAIPRIKLASLLALILAAVAARNIMPICALYGVCLVLAFVSSIGPLYFIKRTFLFIPLFALFIAAPALLNTVTPGRTITAVRIAGWSIGITREGVATASLFFMRILALSSLAVLIVLTTRRHVLLRTLRMFGVPRIFVMTLGMCYRYILLFLDLMLDTLTAIRSRVGFIAGGRTARTVAALNMAGLWLRSYRLHAQVYDAMVSRGYTGEAVSGHRFRLGPADFLLAAFSLSLLIGTLWLNRFFH